MYDDRLVKKIYVKQKKIEWERQQTSLEGKVGEWVTRTFEWDGACLRLFCHGHPSKGEFSRGMMHQRYRVVDYSERLVFVVYFESHEIDMYLLKKFEDENLHV